MEVTEEYIETLESLANAAIIWNAGGYSDYDLIVEIHKYLEKHPEEEMY